MLKSTKGKQFEENTRYISTFYIPFVLREQAGRDVYTTSNDWYFISLVFALYI